MPHPDQALWKQGWRAQHIPFHLTQVHPLLQRFWAQLGLGATDRIFVPLCGKSLDLMWLHALGHQVVGVELSPLAVRAFFKASHLQPSRKVEGEMTCWRQERLAIYCGDFFALTPQDLLGVTAIYDRAALTALPEALRAPYVAHLHAIVPPECQMLLLTVEDLDDDELAADCESSSNEILALYAGRFTVSLLHTEFHASERDQNGLETAPRCVHKVYRLQREAGIASAIAL